jgi:hypothetical protein
MPRIPVFNAASDIIAAFEAGRSSRRQREQDQLKKETDQRDFEQGKKQFEEQLKLQREQASQTSKYQQAQIKHQQALEEFNRSQREFQIRQGIATGLIKPGMKEDLAPGENWALKDPQTVLTPQDYSANGINIPAASIVLPEEYTKALREQDLAKGASEVEAIKAREALNLQAEERRNTEYDRRDQNNFTQQKQMFDLTSARMMGMLNARNQGGPVNEKAKDYNLALLKSGGLTYDSFSGKDKDKYYNLAVSNGIFPQTKKFVDDSKKLTSTAQFYKLIDRLANNNLKDPNEFAQLLADSASITQQIGTLGAQYPALGRLSDPDIRLLQTGQPSAKLGVLSKLFGSLPDNLRKNLLKNMKNSYAGQVLSHLSTVPPGIGSKLSEEELTNPEIRSKYPSGFKPERQRLLEHYNLYIPGMEQTDVFRNRLVGGGK